MKRRGFLKVCAAAGGGLAIGFPLVSSGQAAWSEINAWVVVERNGRVVIRYARSEMGQGSMTAAAQLVAEELECDWNTVRVEYVDTNAQVRNHRRWGDMGSVGSRTIRRSQEALRSAGAAARELLIAAAARAWQVPAGECRAERGFVLHTASARKADYGSLAAAAAKLEPSRDVALKTAESWRIAGKPIPRVEIPDIVTGRIGYGIDAQVEGMLYAAVAQCPVFGGRVKALDQEKVIRKRGVLHVLAMREFVAVVADNWWRAKEALRELPIHWDFRGNDRFSSEAIVQRLHEALSNGEEAAAAGAREAEYFTPYLAHATLEPQNCTALLKDGKLDVWASTQDAEATHRAAAQAAGVSLENVYVHRVQAGGGFGRRAMQDYVRQGVAIAKALEGTPVKTVWTREEDLQHDFYRPASLVRARALLDERGKPTALRFRVAAPSVFASNPGLELEDGVDPQAVAALADSPYRIPTTVQYVRCDFPVPVGLWRGVGHSQNPFVRECFIDELADASGEDPYEYRRALLPPESRELAILDAVARAASWAQPAPDDLYRGIAVTEAYGSYTAAVAEVSVSDDGRVDIRRIVVGIDCGHVVNPDNVVAQMQGSVVFMLSAMFWGAITIREGRVEQSSFADYRLMRLREMPKVEVVLAPSGGFWGGVGEPGQAAIAPALANAVSLATGRRIRSLPLKDEGLEIA